MHYFHRETNLKLQLLPYNSLCFYFAFNNELKANKANPALFFNFISSKLHEVKSTDMQCILTANNKQMSWEETTGKKKMTDLCLGNVFQLTSRRISRKWTRSGTNLVIFLEAICAQTNLFWREMKILKS